MRESIKRFTIYCTHTQNLIMIKVISSDFYMFRNDKERKQSKGNIFTKRHQVGQWQPREDQGREEQVSKDE